MRCYVVLSDVFLLFRDSFYCEVSSHSKQALDLYCKTCSSLICRDCTLKDHPRETHDFDFIDDVVDEEREKIKQATAPLKRLLE